MGTPIDEQKLEELLGRVVVDFGAVSIAPLVLIGDQLGLYRALAEHGPVTASELATHTGTHERYIREWLNAQAASGYVRFLAESSRYELTPEQSLVFVQEGGPGFMIGAFQTALAAGRIADKLADAFRSGDGIGWHQHDHALFHGIERFFRSGYIGNLTQTWIPAIAGMEERLRAGARVADIGCGHGASTVLMAQAYPASEFIGFDYHAESIAAANQRALQAGVAQRCRFEVASAKDFPGRDYDFVTVFDALHDMGDPVGAARHVLGRARPAGKLDDRGALCGRPCGREPQSGRSGLLRSLNPDLHAVLIGPGSRTCAGRAGRRSAHARGSDWRRIHAIPARDADTVQPDLRSAAVVVGVSEQCFQKCGDEHRRHQSSCHGSASASRASNLPTVRRCDRLQSTPVLS